MSESPKFAGTRLQTKQRREKEDRERLFDAIRGLEQLADAEFSTDSLEDSDGELESESDSNSDGDSRKVSKMSGSPRKVTGERILEKINVKSEELKLHLDSYFKRFDNFFKINNFKDDEGPLKLQYLEAYMGEEVEKRLTAVPDSERTTYEDLKKAIYARLIIPQADAVARGEFFRAVMEPGQTSRDFQDMLWVAIRKTDCKDPKEQEKSVLAAFTSRHANPEVIKHFQDNQPTSMNEAITMCDQVERRQRQTHAVVRLNQAMLDANASMHGSGAASVEAVANARQWRPRRPVREPPPAPNGGCGRCGRLGCSGAQNCSAWNTECFKCHKKGHIKQLCLTAEDRDERNRRDGRRGGGQGRFRGTGNRRQTGEVEGKCLFRPKPYAGYSERREHQRFIHSRLFSEPERSDTEEVGTVNEIQRQQMEYLQQRSNYPYRAHRVESVEAMDEVSRHEQQVCPHQSVWWENASIEHRVVRLKIDSGAKVSILSRHHLEGIGVDLRRLKPTTRVLMSFQQLTVQPIGVIKLLVTVNHVHMPVEFLVVPQCANILLSFRDSLRAGLMPRAMCVECQRKMKVDEFTAYRREVLSLHVTADAIPYVSPPRPVALAYQDPVQRELKRMVDEGIITPVTEPTDWCSPILIRKKPNGSIRICLDPKYLNRYLKRALFPLPDINQVYTQVQGAVYLSQIDLTQGFWHIKLDEPSSYLCTFATPFGRYRFLRMPFGITPAPEVFHRMVGDVLQGLKGVMHYIDDVLVWGNTKEEHDARLTEVQDRLKTAGFEINQSKSSFGKKEVKYLGHILSGTEIKPNPEKVKAVTECPPPTNVDGVRRILGVATYLSKFLKNFSSVVEPLRQLLRKDVAFHWEETQQNALDEVKKALCEGPVLKIFDGTKPVQLATDASNAGLGAVLLQDGKPVCYVSRSLTAAEQNYSTIEKELLAVVFAVERLKFYTAGRPVEIVTDHKPLVGLGLKETDKVSPRFVKFLDRLLPYVLSWKFVPGLQNVVPDFLSRAPLETSVCENDVLELKQITATEIHGHGVLKKISQVGQEDESVQLLLKFQKHGWPATFRQVPTAARTWWHFRHHLRVVENVVFDERGRVFVPQELRQMVMRVAHAGHPGVNAMVRRLQTEYFWPGQTKQAEQWVKGCATCVETRACKPKQPMQSRPMPTQPGAVVASDYFEWKNRTHLVLYDVFSQFPFLVEVTNLTSSVLIRECQKFFLVSGVPEEFWADRGTSYTSSEFQEFLSSIGTKFIPSSVEHSQSNGAAEAAVKILKKLKQVAKTPKELFQCLLALQNTAKAGMSASPAEIFLGRKQRTDLVPRGAQCDIAWNKIRNERLQKQSKSAEYYNRTVKSWDHCLKAGDRVLVHSPKTRDKVKGIVVKPAETPRAYIVKLASGAVSVRNIKYLALVPNRQQSEPGEDTAPHRSTEPRVSSHAVPQSGIRSQRSPGPATTGRWYRNESGRMTRIPDRFQNEDNREEAAGSRREKAATSMKESAEESTESCKGHQKSWYTPAGLRTTTTTLNPRFTVAIVRARDASIANRGEERRSSVGP